MRKHNKLLSVGIILCSVLFSQQAYANYAAACLPKPTDADYIDTDGDGYHDDYDVFPDDASRQTDANNDSDGDGVTDRNDDFPKHANEHTDTDGDCIGNNEDTNDDNDSAVDQDDAFPLIPGLVADTDGDGIANANDGDDDEDGVLDPNDAFPLDPTESVDTDNDGIGDNADPDDDNDDVLDGNDAFPKDVNEQYDLDGDGIGDNADNDRDGDGVLNIYDIWPEDPLRGKDYDGDGIADTIDTDDDNDGVIDTLDALPFNEFEHSDFDGDGIGDNADPDDDNDGLLDGADPCPFDILGIVDTDGDGECDNVDVNDDNDAYPDNVDMFPLDSTEYIDSDNDGIGNNSDTDRDGDGVNNTADAFPDDPTESVDSDGDGTGDNSDTDIDGDGVANTVDAFPLDPSETTDTDGDGTGDNSDADADNDGINDTFDAFPLNPAETKDSDGDGTGDNTDSDRDGDGVDNDADVFPDDPFEWANHDEALEKVLIENGQLADYVGDNADLDDDNDGITDVNDAFPFDPSEWLDTDGDGVGNNADLDDDNDGVVDTEDEFPLDPLEWSNFDKELEKIEIEAGRLAGYIGDNADNDDDNDGVIDTEDAFPKDASEWLNTDEADEVANGEPLVGDNADLDDDNDGVEDALDAFPKDPTEWSNFDADAELAAGEPLTGDNADPDDDNDGIIDSEDAFPFDASEWLDTDGDGIGNIADIDDDNDGVLDFVDAFPLDATETVDTDGDLLGNNADLDDDGDGMSDEFELQYGFDPLDPSDVVGDLDSDGVDNGTEALNNTNPKIDDYPPIISAPNPVNLKAKNSFTTFTLSELIKVTNISVTDGLDGDDCCNLLAIGFETGFQNLPSGVHTITWRAVDATGNIAELKQNINIIPTANFSPSQFVAEGASARVSVQLSGDAPYYPFEVPIVFSEATTGDGSDKADSLDYDFTARKVVIESGSLGHIDIPIIQDFHDEDDESLLLSFAESVNAGIKANHTITITDSNLAPKVLLTAFQQGEKITVIDKSAGEVTVNLAVSDANIADTHIISWRFPQELKAEISANQLNVHFDPTDLVLADSLKQLIPFSVTVVDSGEGELSLTEDFYLPLLEPQGRLAQTDTDRDGIPDDIEGFTDNDYDGIPAFMDNSEVPHLQQLHVNAASTKLIETEPGLLIKLGKYARLQFSDGIQLSQQEMDDTQLIARDSLVHVNEYFDFEIKNVEPVGRPVAIVIPLVTEVPKFAVYRKYSPQTGWQNFVENGNNSISSTTAVNGICPPPTSTDYQAGLLEGNNCLKLIIEDGGPNDVDGIANGTIDDPGGIAVKTVEEIVKQTDPVVKTSGAITLYGCFSLLLLAYWRRRC